LHKPQGWGTLRGFLVFGVAGIIGGVSLKNSDQIDQTLRGFLVFGFVELGGLSGEGPSCRGRDLRV
jgi:hypothetical protein